MAATSSRRVRGPLMARVCATAACSFVAYATAAQTRAGPRTAHARSRFARNRELRCAGRVRIRRKDSVRVTWVARPSAPRPAPRSTLRLAHSSFKHTHACPVNGNSTADRGPSPTDRPTDPAAGSVSSSPFVAYEMSAASSNEAVHISRLSGAAQAVLMVRRAPAPLRCGLSAFGRCRAVRWFVIPPPMVPLLRCGETRAGPGRAGRLTGGLSGSGRRAWQCAGLCGGRGGRGE
ncbi:hypothetical protein NG2371_00437 [Nocardia gamkensis]|nr:hypothetical protein [Nocardia gamkensis]